MAAPRAIPDRLSGSRRLKCSRGVDVRNPSELVPTATSSNSGSTCSRVRSSAEGHKWL